jgi:hypothetical protein
MPESSLQYAVPLAQKAGGEGRVAESGYGEMGMNAKYRDKRSNFVMASRAWLSTCGRSQGRQEAVSPYSGRRQPCRAPRKNCWLASYAMLR